MLTPGLHAVPPGKVATVVTHLEMTARPEARPDHVPEDIQIVTAEAPTPDWFRALFRRVGQDWLWFSSLQLSDAALSAILDDPDIRIWSVRKGGEDLGLLELDFRTEGACELAFFGLAPPLIGTGAGRALMNRAIAEAWAAPITRFHVHTCTLDSPQALAFYIRSGFNPVRQEVEIADDPRLTGDLPPEAAPQIPVFHP
ncbi:MAG: GNAT family N-acetyltransferase [Pseudomonadota bacterium]